MVMLSRKAMMGSGSIALAYQLRDEFLTAQAAPMSDILNSAPGPGKLVKAADTGNNASIANGDLVIAATVSDTDPIYYWAKSDGSGFTRENGLALVAYQRDGAWIGWSDSTSPMPETLIYGAKGRNAWDGAVEWNDALPYGDVVHILVLTPTDAQHIVRIGTSEYLAFTYPTGAEATLWPALLGKVSELESVYVYPVVPRVPVIDIPNPVSSQEFNLPGRTYLLEFDVVSFAKNATTSIVLHEQDSENRLVLQIQTSGAMVLYRTENGTTTYHFGFSAGGVVDGDRVVIQMRPGSRFLTTNGSGTAAKMWAGGGAHRTTTVNPPFEDAILGRFESLPSGTVLANFKVWEMNL